MIGARHFLAGILLLSSTAAWAGSLVDEVRLGASRSFGGSSTESGTSGSAEIYFAPFERPVAGVTDVLLSPRIQFGALAGEGPDQAYAGLNWHVPIGEVFFVELGIGGTVHNGSLDDGDGPHLGCRLLFREHAAAGVELPRNLRLMATVDHSSSANLCDGPNEGLTHAGLALGVKF